MLNPVNQGYEKKMKILIYCILKTVHYRVYKCTAILHTPMETTHGGNSMSKLDNDANRVANIYRCIWNYSRANFTQVCVSDR